MKKILIPIVTAISTTLLFGGCLSLHGGKKTTENKTQSVTLGQQLTDLKNAYDSGAISKKEYKEQKKKLLKDY